MVGRSSSTVLLRGGRVIDPETAHDAVADVLVEGAKVSAVGPGLDAPAGAKIVDAAGLVVGPGFVDLHSHVHTVAGQRLQALDGVTTVLDLEAGLMPVSAAYRKAAAEGRPLNYGFSASWADGRGQVLAGVHPEAALLNTMRLLADERWQRSSTASQLEAWIDLLRGELEAGALGIGILVGYAPRTDPAEYLAVARLAAEAGVPTWTHVRELVEADPSTPVDGTAEVVRAAGETGAHMHHCHVNSTSRRHIDRVLETIERSQAEGSRVTVEAYPYGAGSTGVGAFFLAPDRLAAWGIGPSSIVLLPSGERVADTARLIEVRREAPETECIVEFLDENDPADMDLLRRSQLFPDAIAASDAMPVLWPGGRHESSEWPLPAGGVTHPRTAGTFCRTLRLYVRESRDWTWLEAFRRCSYLPARTLDFAPAARGKGRLQPGADADIVVIDPAVVTDAATYTDSTRPSIGVRHLLVNGEAVVAGANLVIDAFPGRPLRAEPA
jgi:N-acyl-D-aspartate/D-glutamate deacylase